MRVFSFTCAPYLHLALELFRSSVCSCCNMFPSNHYKTNIYWSTSWHTATFYSSSGFSVSRLGGFALYFVYFNVHCKLMMTGYVYACRQDNDSDTVPACAALRPNQWKCVEHVCCFLMGHESHMWMQYSCSE